MPNRYTDALIKAIPLFGRLRQQSRTLIEVEIDSKALIHNAEAFIKYTGLPIAPVLKSNAYGHGLVEVATVLEHSRVDHQHFPFFVVDSYHEALTLRRHGILTPILVIGYTFTDTITQSKLANVIFTITSLDALRDLSDKITAKPSKRPIKIHLKIDSGMHRQGIGISEITEALQIIRKTADVNRSEPLILEGIASHLADAPNTKEDFTLKQIDVWNKCVDEISIALSNTNLPALRYIHLSNTAGHVHYKKIKMNVSRLGLGLYGYADRPELENQLCLRPALSLKSVVSQIKTLHAGESAGYDCAFVAPQDMTIAIIPAGYNEGIDRRLSNINTLKDATNQRNKNCTGFFTVKGQPCPIVGIVSMNITAIDVSRLVNSANQNVTGVKRDDEVIIISNNPDDINSIKSIAKNVGAIAYEIMVKIPASLRRVVK